ncbi:hypothetical protein TrCOL_g387 [Triparma columacea]|uniref:sn-1-specific diacylglycerol lipase n=1 Tax=Triparma columacea TaxID=722753 RepID=A0A9W7GK38_9STRA|nr:hypothetical protein TrCOL_g387 [Triparma columacea]
MFWQQWALTLSFPPLLAIFVLGLICGAIVLLVVLLLLFLLIAPGNNLGQTSKSSSVPSSPGPISVSDRTTAAQTLISKIQEPLISALDFSDRATKFGFTVALQSIRFGFSVGHSLLHGLLHLFPSPSSRLHLSLRWITEVVGYADMITVTVVSTNKTVTHVSLQTALHILQLNEHLSILPALQLLKSTGFWGILSPPTISAIVDTLSLIRTELIPISDALYLPHLFRIRSSISSSPSKNPPSITPPAPLLSVTSPSLRHGISLYIRHALGTYGEKGLKFLGVLPYASASSNIEGYMKLTNMKVRGNVISTDFEGGLFMPGYVLSIDEIEQSIVLAVRGTIWPHDFLTDLVCEAELLPKGFAGVGKEGMYAHKGMMRSAVGLAGKLRHLIIEICLNDKYSTYPLVLTGHSLGAGVACIMSALFLSPSTHPALSLPPSIASRLKCYGYGTPAVMTGEICERLKEMVTSVVIGMDMVPRFSLRTFRIFRDKLIEELEKEKGGVGGGGGGRGNQEETEGMPVLLPAGRIVWVDEESEGQRAYVRDNGEFDEMGMDASFASHMPQNYYRVVKDRWLKD